MWIVCWSCSGGRHILQALHTTALLDIVGKIAAGTKLYDEIDVPVTLLYFVWISASRPWCTEGLRTTMSSSRVICRCDSAFRISISPWRLSNSFWLSPLRFTVLIATAWCVSCYAKRRISVRKEVRHKWTHFMVSAIYGCETALAYIAYNYIRLHFVVFCPAPGPLSIGAHCAPGRRKCRSWCHSPLGLRITDGGRGEMDRVCLQDAREY